MAQHGQVLELRSRSPDGKAVCADRASLSSNCSVKGLVTVLLPVTHRRFR